MARLDTDLLGLQIVAKDRASVVGEIDGLIIDDEALQVAGFLVDLGLYEARALPFEDALAVGEDAVIVATPSVVVRISDNPRLAQLAAKEITLSDATALTLSGKAVGTVGDFYVDTESGSLLGLEFYPEETDVYPPGKVVLPASTIRRLGRDIVILSDDYDRHFLKDAESLERMEKRRIPEPEPVVAEELAAAEETGLQAAEEETAAETEPPAAEEAEAAAQEGPAAAQEIIETEAEAVAEEAVAEGEVTAEEAAPEEADLERPAPEAEAEKVGPEEGEGVEVEPEESEGPETQEEPETAGLEVESALEADATVQEDDALEAGQRHFLVGKRVVRRIETPAGDVIAEEGQIVDYEMIQAAKSSDLLLILSLNVE
ncbi:MAG: hypothetical protein Kow00129_11620 [Thermoleophilia bacterium]